MISEPYNTYVDESFWSVEYEQDENVPKFILKTLHYRNIEERNNKLEAVSFYGQYGDKVSLKLSACTMPIWGMVLPRRVIQSSR